MGVGDILVRVRAAAAAAAAATAGDVVVRGVVGVGDGAEVDDDNVDVVVVS